eukprot:CAMPEP_0173149572 /NCGR_PEP_ID=MMETSP1105-20130129/10404_1 /TAXON_ID=2985 /ORGANISM="Ochromonas sp., Strain BG-1" /LENGTH=579 /DNA_ID=CAMNT_0014064461 /DNA_START=323 /DNA_END=2062 /DNA_ORIENTATION=-
MNRFDCLEIEEIDLDRLSYLDHLERGGGISGIDSKGGIIERGMARSKFAKQNVALFVSLREKTIGKVVIFATCHIHWNPNLPEVKFAQTQLILEELTRFRTKHEKDFIATLKSSTDSQDIPIILTGDFNSFPHDDLYALVTGKMSLPPHQYLILSSSNILGEEDNAAAVVRVRPGIKKLYGPNTKFLCDFSLSKLSRWLRILGIDVAMDSWENHGGNSNHKNHHLVTPLQPSEGEEEVKAVPVTSTNKSSSIQSFFQRARMEKRVILTSSKSLLDRSNCPPSFYVNANNIEKALVHIYAEYGLDLNRERFLTVCGKCGGEIEEVEGCDYRLVGKIIPMDRQIYACKLCGQPYWWNDEENSSPAKAMKKAEELYQIISVGLAQLSNSFSTAPVSASAVSPLEAEEEKGVQDKSLSVGVDSNNSNDVNLQEMFKRRNHVVSSGILKATQPTDTPTPFEEDIKIVDIELTSNLEEEKKEKVDASPHPELIRLRSVFEDNEPLITNWSGEFEGTLDYIFLSDTVKAANSFVFPKLEKNEHLLTTPPNLTMTVDDVFEQLLRQSQPSTTWPSDHFLLYSEVEIL